MLGSPRKHKTLTHALQYLHIALSGGVLFSNQNSNCLLNSIQIWESTDTDKKPFRLPIWLSDTPSFVLTHLFLHNLDKTQLQLTTKLCKQHSFSGRAVWWNMFFPYNPPINLHVLDLEISLGAMLVRNTVRLRLLLPQHNKNFVWSFSDNLFGNECSPTFSEFQNRSLHNPKLSQVFKLRQLCRNNRSILFHWPNIEFKF